MAATKTATETIRLGNYTKQVTKASNEQAAVVAECVEHAKRGLVIVVKNDYAGRWQGFARRRHVAGDFEHIPGVGRRAKRTCDLVEGGKVYLVESGEMRGEVAATVIQ